MLTEALAALAGAAGSALVSAMTEDVWEQVKARCAQLLGRGDAQAENRQAERLEQARTALLAADDRDRTAQDAVAAWTTRIGDVLDEHPGEEKAVRELVSFVTAHVPTAAAGAIQMNVSANDQAQQAVQGQGIQNVTFGSRQP
ncbi:hypothetical protein [Nonomuraea sp. NPDC003201]